MKSACALFVLVLLQTMLAITNCDTRRLSDVSQRQIVKEDDVPRVKIKVFRSPTEEADGESFATWGYWIKQPNSK